MNIPPDKGDRASQQSSVGLPDLIHFLALSTNEFMRMLRDAIDGLQNSGDDLVGIAL
jgi:hypothetical protein